MTESETTAFWVAIAEAIAIVIGVVEEVVRNCRKKRREDDEHAEISIEIAEVQKEQKRE